MEKTGELKTKVLGFKSPAKFFEISCVPVSGRRCQSIARWRAYLILTSNDSKILAAMFHIRSHLQVASATLTIIEEEECAYFRGLET
jgi:hypothetical protein